MLPGSGAMGKRHFPDSTVLSLGCDLHSQAPFAFGHSQSFKGKAGKVTDISCSFLVSYFLISSSILEPRKKKKKKESEGKHNMRRRMMELSALWSAGNCPILEVPLLVMW